MPEVATEVLQDMVNHVEKTNEVIEKVASLEAAISQRAPIVADKLVKAGYLNESQRESAAASLQDPLKALESLEKIAEGRIAAAKDAPPPTMGGGEAPRNAGTVKSASNRDGGSDADRVFLQRLGLA